MTTTGAPCKAVAIGPKIARPSGVWAREKLELLRYYLGGTGYRGGGFLQATSSAGRIFYLDLFAGSGECETKDGQRFDGSPLIAAKGTPPFSQMVWVDADPDNSASLRAHAHDYGQPRSVAVVEGDANAMIGTMLATLPVEYPMLAFLDPEGGELHWTTIERLARHKPGRRNKIELFILFPYNMGIVRFLPRDASRMAPAWEGILDRVMPSPTGWRAIYARRGSTKPADFRRLLLDEYVSGLRRLGYKHVPPPRLIRKENHQPLYFMVFATDHAVGLKIMEDAFNKVQATPRQMSLLSYDQQY